LLASTSIKHAATPLGLKIILLIFPGLAKRQPWAIGTTPLGLNTEIPHQSSGGKVSPRNLT
jgi:hypothetical protein